MSQSYLDSELYLPGSDRARFSWAGHEYEGAMSLQPDQLLELIALELTPEEYGCALYEAVFPAGSPLREGLHDAILEAERRKSRLRVRLILSLELPDRIHALYWELLADPIHRLALARSPDTAFSRYSAVPHALGMPTTGRPRLLCVVSAPSDIERFRMAKIDRVDVLRRIETSLRDLDIEVTILEPPATPGRIREQLVAGGFHLLHLFGHGMIQRHGVSALVLEDEQGQVRLVEEELLAEVFLGDRDLRLVTLIACHGGAQSSGDSFSGLAGRLIQRGLPAVIAMRRAVSLDDAHVFTAHLYRELARTGRVDASVNEARQQLYLADPRSIGWSSPVLYQRLVDGKLWHLSHEVPMPGEAEDTVTARFHFLHLSSRRLLRPLPWLPAILFVIALVLRFLPVSEVAVQLDLHVSQLSFQLAKPSSVIERSRLDEVAATRLAAVRMPTGEWIRAGDGEMEGFLLARRNKTSSHVVLHVPLLNAGTRVSFEHQGGLAYRAAFTGVDQEINVTFQGDVTLKRLISLAIPLHLGQAGTITAVPQNGVIESDLIFSSLEGDEVAPEIAISRLVLFRIEERHAAEASEVKEVSTLLSGDVQVLATGERYRLERGNSLRFASITGAITDLRFEEGGIRFKFRGEAEKPQLVVAGLSAESLAPVVLDLWIAGLARAPLLNALGSLALLTLLMSAVEAEPKHRSRRRPGPASYSI